MNSRKKNNGKSKRRNRNGNRTRIPYGDRKELDPIHRTVSLRNEDFLKHPYVSTIIGVTAGASQFSVINYRTNGAWRPDTTGTDTTQPFGFANYAGIYSNYVVEKFQFDITVSNRENFDIIFCLAPTTFDADANIGTAVEALQLGERKITGCPSYIRTVSAKGGLDKARFRGTISNLKLFGNPPFYEGDQNFVGISASGNPTNLAYLNLAAIAPVGSVLTNGYSYSWRMMYYIKWCNASIDNYTVVNKSLSSPSPGLVRPFKVLEVAGVGYKLIDPSNLYPNPVPGSSVPPNRGVLK